MTGCATTEYVHVKPQCSVPPQPVLPQIESSRMSCLDDETYWDLMERERRLVDWALEMRAVLGAVCDQSMDSR